MIGPQCCESHAHAFRVIHSLKDSHARDQAVTILATAEMRCIARSVIAEYESNSKRRKTTMRYKRAKALLDCEERRG